MKFGVLTRIHRAGEPRLRVVVDEPGKIEVSTPGLSFEQSEHWMLEVAPSGSLNGFARGGFGETKQGAPYAALMGLPAGEYDLWFLFAEVPYIDSFTRAGTPLKVVIDAEHAQVKLELAPPR